MTKIFLIELFERNGVHEAKSLPIIEELLPLIEDEASDAWDKCYEHGTRNVGEFLHHGGIELKTKYFNKAFNKETIYSLTAPTGNK